MYDVLTLIINNENILIKLKCDIFIIISWDTYPLLLNLL